MLVDHWKCYVHPNGYLQRATLEETWKRWREQVLPAIEARERGEEPEYFDNSPFIWVNPILYAGQELTLMSSGIGENEAFSVFTQKGKPVPFEVRYPLSRK